IATNYGLFGDEARGFRFTNSYYTGTGVGYSLYYFINGKFIRSDEKYEGEKYQ
ncbi:tRNA 2-selenouridine synthase, partial [Campylobacter sp. W0018]|nr:tRNA 2-selenouridine synthase [Campylobacter sp. W0018]